jgi:hypothetical protein
MFIAEIYRMCSGRNLTMLEAIVVKLNLLVTWRVVSGPPRRRVEDTSGLCSGH